MLPRGPIKRSGGFAKKTMSGRPLLGTDIMVQDALIVIGQEINSKKNLKKNKNKIANTNNKIPFSINLYISITYTFESQIECTCYINNSRLYLKR